MIQTALILESLRRQLIFDALSQPDPQTRTITAISLDQRTITLSAPLPDAYAWGVMEVSSNDASTDGILFLLKPNVAGSSTVVLDSNLSTHLFPLAPGDQVVISSGPIKDAAEADTIFLLAPTTKEYTNAPIITITPANTTTEQTSAAAGGRSASFVTVNFVLQIMCPCDRVEVDESQLASQTTAMQRADVAFAQITRWLPMFRLNKSMQGVVQTTSSWFGDTVDGSENGQFAVGVRTEASFIFRQSSFPRS